MAKKGTNTLLIVESPAKARTIERYLGTGYTVAASMGHLIDLPKSRVAFLRGKDKPPSIVLKYGASNFVPCYAVALNENLEVLWKLSGSEHSMGHVPTVGDVDMDGRDEIIHPVKTAKNGALTASGRSN